MKREILEKVLSSQKNLIVAGDVATGKTTNVIFPLVNEMIEKEESVLFLDSKEEYINKYYNELKNKNYNIIVLNLRDMDNSDGWNPLAYPYSLYKNNEIDKALEYIEKIGKTMFYEGGNVDPFWTNTASDFFTGVVLGLFEDGNEDEINLNSVNLMYDAINKKCGTSDIISKYFESKGPSSQAYIYASTTFLAPRETKASILSVARQKLRAYVSREKMSLLMNETTFNYEDIISKPTAIFVIGRDETKYLNNVITLFIEQLFAILIDLKSNKKFNFVLDNFDNIENVNELLEMLSSGISRKIKFILSTRSIENLLNKYTSYINKLSNLIVINNNGLDTIINNETEKVTKDFEAIELINNNLEYSKINKKEIRLFDVEKFMSNKIAEEKYSRYSANPQIDSIVEKIDRKIAELEEKERLEKQSENLKSEN